VIVYDLRGRMVKSMPVQLTGHGDQVIELNDVSQGQYMLLVKGNKIQKTFRVTRL